MGPDRKMRCVFLALVMLPAAIAYSSGSASTYASGSSAAYTSAKASAAASSSAAGPAKTTIQVVKATLKLPGVSASAFDKAHQQARNCALHSRTLLPWAYRFAELLGHLSAQARML